MVEEPIEGVIAPGLEGVVAAETTVGDVRGDEGFFHYRQYSATELAERRSFEDVWCLLFDGALPTGAGGDAFFAASLPGRELPPALRRLLDVIAGSGNPLSVLRTAISQLGSELDWCPTLDTDVATLRGQALQLCAAAPVILTTAARLARRAEVVAPRDDLGFAANYLWMMNGEVPPPEIVRALEQYLILVIDHGFNSSTFTARVITSTGADLAAAICGAIGALSGPLHGGAPSRALDMLDAIASPDRVDAYVRELVASGGRVMGFGHRVYRTDDPRNVFLRSVARTVNPDTAEFAARVEETVEQVLQELKSGRELRANVEFYAGVVMEGCGIPREMFTPTFAAARMVGWSVHVLEQAAANRLIRPSSRYVGTPAPQPVPRVV